MNRATIAAASLLLVALIHIGAAAQPAAQNLVSCKLIQGQMASNCDISHLICNSAFEINSEARTVRQIDGLYKSAPAEVEEWTDARVHFRQTAANGVEVRSDLNRLTGEMHVRADWVHAGQQKERVEVWSCSARRPLF